MSHIILVSCLPLKFNNLNIINAILTGLTNVYNNNVFLCFLGMSYLGCCHLKRYTIFLGFLLYNSTVPVAINIPLSNTLFIIHPYILYLCLLITLINYWSSSMFTGWESVLLGLSLTLVLGGYWAIQEFNWGGWWNWDLLEVFIGLLVLLIISIRHISRPSQRTKHLMQVLLTSCLLLYLSANKLGLTTSIHSFITSMFFSKYYFIYSLWWACLIVIRNFYYLNFLLGSILWLNYWFIDLYYAKWILLYLFFIAPRYILTKWVYLTHVAGGGVICVFLLINYLNLNKYIFVVLPKLILTIGITNFGYHSVTVNAYFHYLLLKHTSIWFKITNLVYAHWMFFIKFHWSDSYFVFF